MAAAAKAAQQAVLDALMGKERNVPVNEVFPRPVFPISSNTPPCSPTTRSDT